MGLFLAMDLEESVGVEERTCLTPTLIDRILSGAMSEWTGILIGSCLRIKRGLIEVPIDGREFHVGLVIRMSDDTSNLNLTYPRNA